MEFQGQRDNPANRVDEYGNPFPLAGHDGGGMAGAHSAHGTGGQFQPSREEHKTGGMLRRSGSSSSSSEDDGVGGRRKKGMKEKIKEKLPGPGGHKDDQQHMAAGTGAAYGQHAAAGTGGAYGQQGHAGMNGANATGEKKGLMDKIKEKLPGQH